MSMTTAMGAAIAYHIISLSKHTFDKGTVVKLDSLSVDIPYKTKVQALFPISIFHRCQRSSVMEIPGLELLFSSISSSLTNKLDSLVALVHWLIVKENAKCLQDSEGV